jgi:outer membrane protein OmpA-like peptidoglycan-associated protein
MRVGGLAAFGALLMLGACAGRGSVVILPPSDGHVGGVVVHTDKSADVVLDRPYAAGVPGDSHVTLATAQSVDKQFHDAMTAFPKPPKTFTLFFERDNAELTKDISDQFSVVDAFMSAQDQPSEIVITGHTDTSGARDYNEKLSLRRAELINSLFVSAVGKDKLDQRRIKITTAGRGSHDAVITPGVDCKVTPDEKSCHDARNVEITVQ